MKWYQIFETTSGHILVLFLLVLVGWFGATHGMSKGEDITLGAFTALLALLKNGKQL